MRHRVDDYVTIRGESPARGASYYIMWASREAVVVAQIEDSVSQRQKKLAPILSAGARGEGTPFAQPRESTLLATRRKLRPEASTIGGGHCPCDCVARNINQSNWRAGGDCRAKIPHAVGEGCIARGPANDSGRRLDGKRDVLEIELTAICVVVNSDDAARSNRASDGLPRNTAGEVLRLPGTVTHTERRSCSRVQINVA